MRKKIYRMSEDQFEMRKNKIVCSVEKIKEICTINEDFEGEFQISSSYDSPIRGVIYSTNPYVILKDVQFDGTNNTIKYMLKNCGFLKGDNLEGEFVIISNSDSKHLPYEISFSERKVSSSIGPINDLQDFTRLARENYIEANKIFHSDIFSSVLSEESLDTKLLYQGYKRSFPSLNNLEEFLVSCNLKERISFKISNNKVKFDSISENQKEEIVITKDNWGNLEIDVYSDSDFVTVEKNHIDSDYFLGSTLNYNYYIHKNRMHKGRNIARITFDSNNQHEELIIEAKLEGDDTYVDYTYSDRKRRKVEFLKTYEEYRLRRITTGDWTNKSIELIDSFIADIMSDEEDKISRYQKYKYDIEFFELMKAHCYIANKQRQEALWIIQNIKRDISDKKSVKWAYLLYLCTLIEKEPSYVDRLTHEIEVIFRQHPNDVRIFWFLLFLRDEYINNSNRKLKAVYQWLNNDYNTPYLYVEIYALYRQDPYLLTELSDTTINVLEWSRRHDAITEDMCMQFFALLGNVEEYSEKIYRICEYMYQVSPSTNNLEAIVNYLMRFSCYGKKYLKWYELCIYKEMKITGIYEAYLMCLEGEELISLPQIILMYFKYQSNISYDKKAIVYSNVILNKNEYPSIYNEYLRTIELFAIEQMQLGHINDSLAIIYQDVLDNGIINEDIASDIAPLLHTARITMVRNVSRVMVVEEQLENPIVVPVQNKVAYVPIFSKNYKIFLEDSTGNVYANPLDYMCEFMLDGDDILDNLKIMSPTSMPYVLRYFEELKDSSLPKFLIGNDDEALKIEDLHCVETFISSKEISKKYKNFLYPLIIYFLQKHGREEMIEKHLCEEVDYSIMDAKTLSYIITLFISIEMYDRAYYLITSYNGTCVDKKYINTLCEYMIKENLEEIDDDFFVSLCSNLIGNIKMSDYVVEFLNRKYVGPTEKMIELWVESKELLLESTKLEDRILVQMYYCEEIHEKAIDVFKSYMSGEYNRMLVEAIVTYYAHEYMIENVDSIDEFILAVIAKFYNRQDKMNDSSKIALMKYLCLKKNLDEDENNILDSLIREYIVKNVYFSFYKNVKKDLIVKYHLYDKVFVEYHGNPNERICIVSKKDKEELVVEEMVEMYKGIYVKQFVVFFGDSIQYEIFKDGDNENVLKKDTVVFNDIVNERNSRYDLINKMQSSLIYFEEADLLSEMKAYQGLDYVTKQIFSRV